MDIETTRLDGHKPGNGRNARLIDKGANERSSQVRTTTSRKTRNEINPGSGKRIRPDDDGVGRDIVEEREDARLSTSQTRNNSQIGTKSNPTEGVRRNMLQSEQRQIRGGAKPATEHRGKHRRRRRDDHAVVDVSADRNRLDAAVDNRPRGAKNEGRRSGRSGKRAISGKKSRDRKIGLQPCSHEASGPRIQKELVQSRLRKQGQEKGREPLVRNAVERSRIKHVVMAGRNQMRERNRAEGLRSKRQRRQQSEHKSKRAEIMHDRV